MGQIATIFPHDINEYGFEHGAGGGKGEAGLGEAGLGEAGLGEAGLGEAGLGEAGLARTEKWKFLWRMILKSIIGGRSA